jgi:tetratricopeptide (TPR) repeat protein
MMNQTVRLTLSIGIVALIAGVAGIACAPRATQDPTRPAAVDLYVRAMEAYNQGDRAAAIAGLIDATQANPELRMAHSMLGDLYREQGAYARAAPHYEAMTQLDPYHLDNHYRLGVTYHLLARLQDAAAAYLRALQLNPQDMRSNMNLGLVYLSLGQLDDAARPELVRRVVEPRRGAGCPRQRRAGGGGVPTIPRTLPAPGLDPG